MDTEGDPPIECRQKRAIFEQTAILAGGAQKERMRVHPLLRCCVLSALARMDLVDAAGAGVSRAWLPSSVTAGEQDKIDPDSMKPNLAITVRFVHARSDRHGQCRSGWRQARGLPSTCLGFACAQGQMDLTLSLCAHALSDVV